MDLRDFASTLMRRWYVTLAVGVLAIAGGYGAAQSIGPTFVASGAVVLIPPESRMDNALRTSPYATTNPLMYLGGLNQARDLLVTAVRSQRVVDEVTSNYPEITYEVGGDPTSSGPIVVMTVSSGSARASVGTLELLNTKFATELDRIQTGLGISAANHIGTFRLATDTVPTVQRKTQLQVGVVGAAAIALLGLLLVGLLDSLLRSRGAAWPGTGPAIQAERTTQTRKTSRGEAGARGAPLDEVDEAGVMARVGGNRDLTGS